MTTPSPQNPGVLNWVLLLSLSVIWGAAFLSVSVALEGFGPLTVAGLRVGIAAVVLTLLAPLFGQGLGTIPSGRAWGFVAAVGIGATALPFTLLAWGQQFVPSAFAGVTMGAVPLIVLPLVYLFSPEEGIGPRRIIGMGLGFIGLVLLIGPGGEDSAEGPNVFLGKLAFLGSAACYAVGSVVTRRAPKMPPLAFAAGGLICGSAVLMPIAVLSEGVPESWPLRPTTGLLYAALLPTAVAAVIRVRIITTAGSLFMSIVSYLVPVWSVILGILLLGEELPANLFLGLGLILAGIGLSQWRSIAGAFRAKES